MEEGNDAGSWGDVCWGIASEHFDGTGRDIQGVELDRAKAKPKETYDALVKRYKDPAQGAGPATLAKYWEPIPYGIYLDPATFYKPPVSMKETAGRKECVECHTDESPYGYKHGNAAPMLTWIKYAT